MPNPYIISALKLAWAILRIALGIWLGFGLLLFFTQSRYIYAPTLGIEETPADIGLPFEDLFLTTAQGHHINAWHIPGPSDAAATILVCHGNAGNMGNRLAIIHSMHRLGLNVMIFDYSGFGASQGKPSEQNTYSDARAAWGWLTEQRKTPPETIIVMGSSLGGAVASHLATQVKPAGLIIEASFSSLPNLAAQLYPLWPARLMCRFNYNNLENLRKVQCPVLVGHSPGDDMIPFSHGRRIFEAANEPKLFLSLSGPHNGAEFMFSSEHSKTILDFFGIQAKSDF